jgi:dienelactone hydrolase
MILWCAYASQAEVWSFESVGVGRRLYQLHETHKEPTIMHQLPFSRRRFIRASGMALLAGLGLPKAWAEEPDVPGIEERLRAMAAHAPLSMQFRGASADECRKWQGEFSAKLKALLGDFTPPAKWETKVEESAELDDHRRDRLVLKADGFPNLPVYLLTPKKVEGKRPGIIALHGHGGHGYEPVAGRDDLPGVANAIKSCNYDYGRQLVRRGYVVAVPCFTPFGRRLGKVDPNKELDACGLTFIRMQMFGKLLMAENLRDALWALELVARQETVDPKRLGCVGLSLGGRMTMLTTAVEPRIKAAVVSGALNVMQERISKPYGCGSQIIPGLLQFGDVPEIGSLIAPRPCVWEVGSRDKLIIPKFADEALARMTRAYKALGAEEQLQVDRFEGGHEWSGRIGFRTLEKALSS